MSRKSGTLQLAILGLLHESPLHGYELRKRLNALLGPFRAISYGSLYPCLREMVALGWIAESDVIPTGEVGSRRSKIVYKLTADGKEKLQEQLAEGGPSAWDDETFGVRFAFFAHTDADVRLKILEGRRSRLEERHESASTLGRARTRLDRYTEELHRHGLESVEREVRWLNELIATERAAVAARPRRMETAARPRRMETAARTPRPSSTRARS